MKRLLLALLSLVAIFGAYVFISPAQVLADSKTEICGGVDAVSGGTGCATGTAGQSDINRILSVGLTIFSAVIGITAVVMIMVAGFKYITAGGDSGNITSAKHTLIYALIGLVVVALAQFLVQFVLDKAVAP